MAEILFKDESYKIMGAMFEVYKEMGCGFLESVYQECVEFELADQKVPFVAQIQLELKYKQLLKSDGVSPWHYCQFWTLSKSGIRTNCPLSGFE